MATIKDALDIIGKLTTKDRERLRTMLLSTVSHGRKIFQW